MHFEHKAKERTKGGAYLEVKFLFTYIKPNINLF